MFARRRKIKEFTYLFEISRKIIFEVSYNTCGINKRPDFSTTADEFNQPKTGFDHCGQAQDALLPRFGIARQFYEKWDKKHSKNLSSQEYTDLLNDIDLLKKTYNYFFKDFSKLEKPYCSVISFKTEKDLSKMKMPDKKHPAMALKVERRSA